MKIIDFKNSDLWKLLRPPLIQFSIFNNFLWVCWFLGKNLSNFVLPVWKLHNSYCHTENIHPCFQPIEEKLCDSEDDEGEVEDKLGQLQPSLHHQLAPHAPLVNPLWRSTTPTGEFTRMPSPPNWLHWSDWFYTKRNVKNT